MFQIEASKIRSREMSTVWPPGSNCISLALHNIHQASFTWHSHHTGVNIKCFTNFSGWMCGIILSFFLQDWSLQRLTKTQSIILKLKHFFRTQKHPVDWYLSQMLGIRIRQVFFLHWYISIQTIEMPRRLSVWITSTDWVEDRWEEVGVVECVYPSSAGGVVYPGRWWWSGDTRLQANMLPPLQQSLPQPSLVGGAPLPHFYISAYS